MEDINEVEILLVEDNPNDAELTIRALKKNRLTNKIVHVTDGEEALDYIFFRKKFAARSSLNPKFILLDLKLPKKNGLEVLKEIKASEKTKSIPIVMLTSSKEDKDIVSIELYNSYGQQTFSSNETQIIGIALSEENLYSNLYKIQIGAKTYSLKKPVFKDGNIAGFYKITISRHDFIKGINYRTIVILGSFTVAILGIFMFVISLLNKKLNRPVKLLVKGMNDFADGKESILHYDAKDEIGEIIFHFNKMKGDIEDQRRIIDEEQKSKDYMISAISHDLKTPLTAIRAYAETMVAGEGNNEKNIKEKAKVILNKSDYIKMMIDDLMMYNLLSKKYEMNFVKLEGNEFFEMIFSGYEDACKQKNIELLVDISVKGYYKVDVNQMTRVVDNLLANALRYTPESGQIMIGAFSLNEKFPVWLKENFIEEIKTWKDSGLIVLVQNLGNEIEEGEKDKVFKPFYQSDDSRSKIKWNGVGLGLSIVSLAIEKHGGQVKLISRENHTVFICWLPNFTN